MNFMRHIVVLCILIVFGCTASESEMPITPVEQEIVQVYELIDLSSGGFPLELKIYPDENPVIHSTWNATFGRMELNVKPDVNIFVKQDTVSIASKKEEIESGIFDISYITQNDSLIFYKASLPEGLASYWHFFALYSVDGIYYNFENNPIVECTEHQIEAMIDVVNRITQENYLKNE